MRLLLLAFVVLTTILQAACVVHPFPYVERVRNYKQDQYAASLPVSAGGSLFIAGLPTLFRDTRAARLGDIITIKVDESEVAAHEAETKLNRDSSVNFSMPALMNMVARLQAAGAVGVDPTKLIDIASKQGFDGHGKTTRSGSLIATLQARVKRLLPNGDLYLEGHKIVAVNGEDHHLYLSGVIRQEDVAPDNSVASSRVADAQVMYNGLGILAEQQRQGWLARLFTLLNPM